jgi:flagellar biosynthesis protein FlhA
MIEEKVDQRIPTYVFAAVVLGIVGILVVPLPPFILDAFLSFNIVFAALVILISITISNPLEFAAFAPALLIATLFRLSLDVSATRLILTKGHIPGGVGEVIPAFGDFVVQGNLVVGFIIFAILITIQFIVIASGSARVAEVAARFTLDAMPGKQMAIDAEMHSGMLTQDQAKKKRAEVQRESEFFGAMDGAGKFVKGDATAALIIVVINLIGGVIIGVVYRGLDFATALNTFAILTIGNALITTLPAFLLSTSMGLMVTRVAAAGSLGFELGNQLIERPDVLRVGGVFSLLLAMVPGLPHLTFFIIGIAAIFAAQFTARKKAAIEVKTAASAESQRKAQERRPEASFSQVGVEAITVALGPEIAVQMLCAENSEQVLDRFNDVRREIARETGIVLPGIHLRDDIYLDPYGYVIQVRDEVAGRGTLQNGKVLALGNEQVLRQLTGDETREPVYGLAAKWIPESDLKHARGIGAMVFDPLSVLASHVGQVARDHLSTLFGRQEFNALVEHLRGKFPALMKEIGTEALPLGNAHKAFTLLLREFIWPRDPVATLEAMLDAGETSQDPGDLAEAARKKLVPAQLRRKKLRSLQIAMLDPEFEADVTASWSGGASLPDPRIAMHLREQLEKFVKSMPANQAFVLCTAPLRRALAELAMRSGIKATIYAFNEIPTEMDVRPVSVIGPPHNQRGREAAPA